MIQYFRIFAGIASLLLVQASTAHAAQPAAPTPLANPALSPELQCGQAYGMALTELGLEGARPYFTMGGYFIGRYSQLYSGSIAGLESQVPKIPPAKLKSVLAKCKSEADSATKDLLG